MRPARAAATAAAAAGITHAALRRWPPGGLDRWRRTNYRGAHPLLLAGPAVAVGAAAGCRTVPSAAVLTAACGALGLYDDLAGDAHARGLRGHLRALREGRLTTGMVKLAGLVTAAAATSAAERRRSNEVVVDTLLVAGTANLVNLFDLRPGRALKVVVLAGFPLAAGGTAGGSVAAGAAIGAALAALPADLGEKTMIGDCGANALGALVGWSMSHRLSGRRRTGALAAVVGLTLASERVSFTDVIARTRWLAALDGLGRRP